MFVSLHRVHSSAPAILVRLPVSDVAHLPGTPVRAPGRHVLLLSGGEQTESEIRFPISAVQVLVVGDEDEAVAVISDSKTPNATHSSAAMMQTTIQRAGDDEFIAAAGEVDAELQRTAQILLSRIRQKCIGRLVGTDSPRKFVEAPDNFWAVEVQNRKRAIKLIIRSTEQRLKNSGLRFSSERPPCYFNIKVENDRDIEDALRFWSLAEPKR